MPRGLSVALGALTPGLLSLPMLPRALIAPLGLQVQRLPKGASVRSADRAGCDLLAMDWRWGSDPWRGEGSYFVGQRWIFRDGAPTPTGPIRARRQLYSFQPTLVSTPEGSWRGAPAAWLRVAQDWEGPTPVAR